MILERRSSFQSLSFKELIWREMTLNSWWVWVFCALCFVTFQQAMHKKRAVADQLQSKIDDFNKKKAYSLEIQEDLLLQIESQNDPDWIEYTLMKGLGVVPEGHTKVYFDKKLCEENVNLN